MARTGRPIVTPTGDNLFARYRAEHGISQKALAELLAVSRAIVVEMKNNNRKIGKPLIRLLCLMMAMDDELKDVQKNRVRAKAAELEQENGL